MKEKVQSIKLNGMLCIIFIAITYLVTLNIENGFFQPICGGCQIILL